MSRAEGPQAVGIAARECGWAADRMAVKAGCAVSEAAAWVLS